jgi:hypothetical protein
MVHPFSSITTDGAGGLFVRARAFGLWLYAVLCLASLVRIAVHGLSLAPPPWLLLDLAYGWWVALSFVFLQVALGRRVLRPWLEKTFGSSGLTVWLVAFTTGFWLSAIFLMVLAWLRLIDRHGPVLYLLAAALVALRPSSLDWRSIKRRYFPAIDRAWIMALLLTVGVLAAMLPYFAQSLLPNSDWDGASTHLPLAEWLRVSGLAPIQFDQSNLIIPGTVHLVYALFQSFGAEHAIIPLNLLISVLTCLAAASVASRIWGKTAGYWGFGICLSINILMELGLDPRIDGFLAFFCTMGALGILVYVLEGAKPGALVFTAVALGNALGSKYTALFPLLLWGLPVGWALLRGYVARPREQVLAVLLGIVCLLVPSGYWYVSNTVRLGDPLYPHLLGQSVTLHDGRSVRLAAAVDALVVEARTEPDFLRDLERTRAEPSRNTVAGSLFDPISLLLHPDRHSRKPAHFLSPLLLVFFLLPVCRRELAAWLLFWMGLSTLVAIGSQTHLTRYGLVFYPLLAVGSGVVLAGVRSHWWRIGWVTALAAVLAGNIGVEWSKMDRQEPWSWLRGDHDRVGWLAAVGYNHVTVMPQFIRAFDELLEREHLPRDGRMLMVGEAKTHLLRFDSIPDISRTGRPWLARLVRGEGDLERVHRDLWADGVRYILINLDYLQWVRNDTLVDYEELAFSLHRLVQFTRAHGKVRLDRFGMILVEIDPPADGVHL